MSDNQGAELRIQLPISYDQAIERIKEALAGQGFGVLTTVDVKKTLKDKLDVDFRRYVILGACNPNLAHQAFQQETEIGLLLPCNVIVYEEGEGSSIISIMDPQLMSSVTENPGLQDIAWQARSKLAQAIQAVRETT